MGHVELVAMHGASAKSVLHGGNVTLGRKLAEKKGPDGHSRLYIGHFS